MTSGQNPENLYNEDPPQYRKEDVEALATLKKMDRKLKTFKIATYGFGLLFILTGLWSIIGQENNKMKKKTATIQQEMDSLIEINEGLEAENQDLRTSLFRQKKLIDSLKKQEMSETSKNNKVDSIQTYEVQQNDNLWKIAENFYNNGFEAQKIIKANNLDSPDYLRVGQKLKIPK